MFSQEFPLKNAGTPEQSDWNIADFRRLGKRVYFQSKVKRTLNHQDPHPALRATFSPRTKRSGRRDLLT
jgi:hypothetical protein